LGSVWLIEVDILFIDPDDEPIESMVKFADDILVVVAEQAPFVKDKARLPE